MTIFCYRLSKIFPPSKLTKIGFYTLGIFYGIATIVVGIFPCDSGCNPEFIDPSISQVIHNIVGALTYVFVPLSILLIGIGLKQDPIYNRLSTQGIIYGLTSMMFVFVLFSDATSELKGLYQRIIEIVFIFWFVSCAIAVKNKL
jgi:predicted permease